MRRGGKDAQYIIRCDAPAPIGRGRWTVPPGVRGRVQQSARPPVRVRGADLSERGRIGHGHHRLLDSRLRGVERRHVRSVDENRRQPRAGPRLVRGGRMPGCAGRTAVGTARPAIRASPHDGGGHSPSSATCGVLGWSRYQFERDEQTIHFVQEVGPSAGRQPW